MSEPQWIDALSVEDLPSDDVAAVVLAGVLCGIAGMLLANLNAFASPSSMAWTVSGDLIVMVVLGGMGSVFGPLLGALAFLGLEEVVKGITDHWMAIFGPAIVLMVLAGRGGMAGLLARFDRRRGTSARRTQLDNPQEEAA